MNQDSRHKIQDFTHIDLFAGIGGFSLAARWMNWRTIAWCEKNLACQRILKKHFPKAEGYGDIITTRFKKYERTVNVVSGGFPCKQTSIGAAIHGKRKGLQGADSGLWDEEIRAFEEIGSDWVVVENPSGVLEWEDQIQSDLAGLGYTVSRLEFQACDFGYPHQRRRFLYVGNANGQRLPLTRQTGSLTIEWAKRLTASGGDWITGTPRTVGSFNGLPNRVDRVRQLGNSVMPQMALAAFRKIQSIEESVQYPGFDAVRLPGYDAEAV